MRSSLLQSIAACARECIITFGLVMTKHFIAMRRGKVTAHSVSDGLLQNSTCTQLRATISRLHKPAIIQHMRAHGRRCIQRNDKIFKVSIQLYHRQHHGAPHLVGRAVAFSVHYFSFSINRFLLAIQKRRLANFCRLIDRFHTADSSQINVDGHSK